MPTALFFHFCLDKSYHSLGRARLLLRRSEFESRWSQQFFFCKMWLETSKKTKKRPGLGNFFYKSVATLPTSYSSFLATPEKSIFRGTARTAGRFLRPTSGSCRRVGRTRHEDNAARQDDLHLRHGRTGAKAIRNLTYWSYDRGEYVKFVINSHPSGFYWVSCAHGPSLQPTACRSLLNSLTTKTESKQIKV